MENKLPRMRTLDECAVMLRELDPDTAVSKHYVRRLALTGEIPTVMCGRKRLINFDKLIEYLNGGHVPADDTRTEFVCKTRNTPASDDYRITGIRRVGA